MKVKQYFKTSFIVHMVLRSIRNTEEEILFSYDKKHWLIR